MDPPLQQLLDVEEMKAYFWSVSFSICPPGGRCHKSCTGRCWGPTENHCQTCKYARLQETKDCTRDPMGFFVIVKGQSKFWVWYWTYFSVCHYQQMICFISTPMNLVFFPPLCFLKMLKLSWICFSLLGGNMEQGSWEYWWLFWNVLKWILHASKKLQGGFGDL